MDDESDVIKKPLFEQDVSIEEAKANVQSSHIEADVLRSMLNGPEGSDISLSDEVRQAEMESRLRGMITEVLKPSIVKVTRLQTDQEMMRQKFQEMIDGHQEVLNAQKEAKEHSEVVSVFQGKLGEFWTFNNALEDKITIYQKSAVQRMEELEQTCELNKSNSLRLGRNLDKSLQDMDRINADIKGMQGSLERRIAKNKERTDGEIKQMHARVEEVRELHNKLENEVWGPEEINDLSATCLRKLDMQMRKQTGLLSEALEDITTLQKLDGELMQVAKRQGTAEEQITELGTTTKDLGERVEVFAQEAKADFKQASNLMAAFSANLVREARHSFKDELKHSQEMLIEVDDFVRSTKVAMQESDEFVKSLSRQLEAMVREMRFDLDENQEKRQRDKQSLEEQMRDLTVKVNNAGDSSESMLRGLEHVSGVISMTLQSERMSAALDLQSFVERKDTPYVGVYESTMETVKLRQVRADKGIRQPGLNLERLHRIAYQPQPVTYQGIAFERPQLLALREKLVHVAQEVLQQGPEMKRRPGTGDAAEFLFSPLGQAIVAPGRINSAEQTRCSTPARPGSRGQPGARGSPGLEGFAEGNHYGVTRELQQSPEVTDETKDERDAVAKKVAEDLKAMKTALVGSDVADAGVQLPALSRPDSKQRTGSKARTSKDGLPPRISPPLTAR